MLRSWKATIEDKVYGFVERRTRGVDKECSEKSNLTVCWNKRVL